MEKAIKVCFSGGKRVNAKISGIMVHTDHYPEQGGEGRVPEPFELFLVSSGTCAGVYTLDFCSIREISTDEMSISMNCIFDDTTHRCLKIEQDLTVPTFPSTKGKRLPGRWICQCQEHIVDPRP